MFANAALRMYGLYANTKRRSPEQLPLSNVTARLDFRTLETPNIGLLAMRGIDEKTGPRFAADGCRLLENKEKEEFYQYIYKQKTKALIGCAINAQLVCIFVYA